MIIIVDVGCPGMEDRVVVREADFPFLKLVGHLVLFCDSLDCSKASFCTDQRLPRLLEKGQPQRVLTNSRESAGFGPGRVSHDFGSCQSSVSLRPWHVAFLAANVQAHGWNCQFGCARTSMSSAIDPLLGHITDGLIQITFCCSYVPG
jgi:hypothetical protein